MGFPEVRLRRLRQSEIIRRMVRETSLSPDDFVQPLFVWKKKTEEIPTMPSQFRWSLDEVGRRAKEIEDLGIPAILLFGIPERKDEGGSEAYSESGVVQEACKAIKDYTKEIVLITDVCLCAYTSHGHCGLVSGGKILNDKTLEVLSEVALSHVKAGADGVAPSDMMDGRVGAIRKKLDDGGFQDKLILAYSAKFASSFYGPFREAASSSPAFGDRSTYQMDPGNVLEALREVELDLKEGADIVMVKPALSYLDVISKVKERFGVPVAAYSVSGEYAMVKAASKMGLLDEKRILEEIFISIKRAGADIIITYSAEEFVSFKFKSK